MSLDIKIDEITHKPYDGRNLEFLSLKFSGKDINIKLVNSIRRVCNDNVPNYAYARELIKISTNTTVAYNNDMMTLRLSQLPVFKVTEIDIDPKIDYLHERYWHDVNYLDKTRLIPVDEDGKKIEKDIEVQINVHNNTDIVKSISTDDPGFKVFVDGQKVDMYNEKWPILLIYLRPNDSFKCSMKAVLGCGERDTIWASCTNSWHHYEDDDINKNIIMNLRSTNLIGTKSIVLRAISFLIKKTDITKKEVLRIFDKTIINKGQIKIELNDEDHTLGEIINYEFQNHDDIMYSGIAKPDHLLRNVTILVNFNSSKNSDKYKKIISECFDSLLKKLNFIEEKLEKIAK